MFVSFNSCRTYPAFRPTLHHLSGKLKKSLTGFHRVITLLLADIAPSDHRALGRYWCGPLVFHLPRRRKNQRLLARVGRSEEGHASVGRHPRFTSLAFLFDGRRAWTWLPRGSLTQLPLPTTRCVSCREGLLISAEHEALEVTTSARRRWKIWASWLTAISTRQRQMDASRLLARIHLRVRRVLWVSTIIAKPSTRGSRGEMYTGSLAASRARKRAGGQ